MVSKLLKCVIAAFIVITLGVLPSFVYAGTYTFYDSYASGFSPDDALLTSCGITSVNLGSILTSGKVVSVSGGTVTGTALYQNIGHSYSCFDFSPYFTSDGEYYVTSTHDPSGGTSTAGSYVFININGGSWTFDGLIPYAIMDNSTRFISTVPANGTIVATTTAIGAEIYLNTNHLEISGSSTASYNPRIEIDLTGIDNTYSASFFFPSASTRLATSGDQTFTATTSFTDNGIYSMVSKIRIPAFDQYPGETLNSTSTIFGVGSSSISALQAASASSSIAQHPVANCSITDLTGCVQNALVYLFWPNRSSINLFSLFKDLLYQKAPIGYFAQVQRALSSISSSSTPAIVGWSIPAGILSNFFTPLRTAIAGILWFFFLVHFYHRVKSLNLW